MKTRFEKEASGNSEMALWHTLAKLNGLVKHSCFYKISQHKEEYKETVPVA